MLAQRPNAAITVAVVAYVLYHVAGSDWLADMAYVLFVVSLVFWATQEVTDGINWFRRALGVSVLVLISWSLFQKLHP